MLPLFVIPCRLPCSEINCTERHEELRITQQSTLITERVPYKTCNKLFINLDCCFICSFCMAFHKIKFQTGQIANLRKTNKVYKSSFVQKSSLTLSCSVKSIFSALWITSTITCCSSSPSGWLGVGVELNPVKLPVFTLQPVFSLEFDLL